MFTNAEPTNTAKKEMERKKTPEEIARDLRVGIVIHDNPNTLAEGWAFLVNKEPRRIRGLYDLENDVLWISSGTWDDFFKLGSPMVHNVRRAEYLGVKIKDFAADLGIRIDGVHAQEGGAKIVSFVEQALKIAIVAYRLDDPLRQLQDDSLTSTIGKILPQPPTPKATMTSELDAAYQGWSSCYQPFMDNTVTVGLKFSRLEYAQWLLSNPIPDNSWSYVLDKTGFSHDEVMNGTFPPTLICGTIEFDNVNSNTVSLIAYGCGTTPKKRAFRKWMTDVEYRWISKFARIHVSEYLISRIYLPIPEIYLLPKALVDDPVLATTVSAGVVAYMHWQSMVAGRYSSKVRKNVHDPMGTWLRSYDRSKCFEAAFELQQRGFFVTGYGNGAIYIKVEKNRLVELSDAVLDLGLVFPKWNALLQEFGYAPLDPI